MNLESSIGLVILAAGASRRLGEPKQLLNYQSTSLLQKVVDLADDLKVQSKLLILGAHSDEIRKEINTRSFQVLTNAGWEEGIASTIRAGLSKIIEDQPNIQSVMFLLSDQPHLTGDHLGKLIAKHHDDHPCITGSLYANQIGVPVIFSYHYFEELLSLKGDQGAKKIVIQHPESIQSILFKHGEIDIDTREDYEKLLSQNE